MIALISPAKSLNFDEHALKQYTVPRLMYDTDRLSQVLKKKSAKSLSKLMNISAPLAQLNEQRFKHYQEEHSLDNSKQAAFAFNGDVYRGLEAQTMDPDAIQFAQNHIRILSGYYGLLRPLDLIQPYRLEMGSALTTSRGKNLYKFWGKRITTLLNEDIEKSGAKALINLASKEYYKAVHESMINVPIIEVNFKEYRNDTLTFISFNAKKARGLVARFIADHKIEDPESLKSFDTEGYEIDMDLSTESKFMFTR